MAELVGLVASVATLLHVARKVQEYGQDYFNAKEQQDELVRTLGIFETKVKLLGKLQDKASKHPNDERFEAFRAILKSSEVADPQGEKLGPDPNGRSIGALERIQNGMEKTKKKLEALSHPSLKLSFKRMGWHHDKKKFHGIIEKIAESIKEVESVLAYATFDTAFYASEVGEKVFQTHKTEAEERQRVAREKRRVAIIGWLSPLSFQARQSEIYNLCRKQNVSTPSLLKSPEFDAWTSGSPWMLRCVGEPGAGKTFLCALVVQRLKSIFENRNVPVLCLYLNYKESSIQTLENLIGSLLKQLLQHPHAEFQSLEAKRLFSGAENESRPTLDAFYQAFKAEIQHFERYGTAHSCASVQVVLS